MIYQCYLNTRNWRKILAKILRNLRFIERRELSVGETLHFPCRVQCADDEGATTSRIGHGAHGGCQMATHIAFECACPFDLDIPRFTVLQYLIKIVYIH